MFVVFFWNRRGLWLLVFRNKAPRLDASKKYLGQSCETLGYLKPWVSQLTLRISRVLLVRVYTYIYILVGGLEHILFFHILGMSSSQLTFIFFRGVGQPPTSIYIYIWSCAKTGDIKWNWRKLPWGYLRPFSSIELACAVRQPPSPCVRALCESGVLFRMSHLKPHFALHTSHCSLHTPHYTLHTPHFTLHTALFALHTSLHSALLRLHTSHFTVHASHFSLLTAFFILHTPHFTLHTPDFTLHSSRPTLHTALFTLHTSSHLSFYTQNLLHTESFYTQNNLLHTASVYTQNTYTQCFYTWQAHLGCMENWSEVTSQPLVSDTVSTCEHLSHVALMDGNSHVMLGKVMTVNMDSMDGHHGCQRAHQLAAWGSDT